jgi:hypothetical protein
MENVMNTSHLMLMAIENERQRPGGRSPRQAPAPGRERPAGKLRRVLRRRSARMFTRPTVTGAAGQSGL